MTNRFKVRDACRVTFAQTTLIGLIAACILCAVFAAFDPVGNGLSPETLIGSQILGSAGAKAQWWTGLLANLIAGGLVAHVYAFIFRSAHRSGWAVGTAMGALHALIGGSGAFIIALLVHWELSPKSSLFWTTIAFVSAHVLYGTTVGTLFDRFAICEEQYATPIS